MIHKGISTEKVSAVRDFFRWLLGTFIMYAGISHLTFSRAEFQAQVPHWLPMNKDLVVILSGIVEIAIGSSLILLPKYRVLMGWLSALFFVIVFPGNIWQYLDRIDAFGLNTDRARFIRLFFQPLFITWALWSTCAWRDRKGKNLKNKKI